MSVATHVLVVLFLLVTLNQNAPSPPPPAMVMLAFAENVQVTANQSAAPLGVNQRRKVEASREEITPDDSEKSQHIVKADNADMRVQKKRISVRKPVKQHDVKRQEMIQKEPVAGNAVVTSHAALRATKIADKTAAPVENDTQKIRNGKMSWEGLVKGKINRGKNYPADAKRRGRQGVATVSFTVNAAGDVLESQLVNSSGTLSLDREALAMVRRASPLPPPPAEIIMGGMHKVTMPVEFDLNRIN
ncbi:hypothetical protein A0E43_10025 [Pectobacterium cacticida]